MVSGEHHNRRLIRAEGRWCHRQLTNLPERGETASQREGHLPSLQHQSGTSADQAADLGYQS